MNKSRYTPRITITPTNQKAPRISFPEQKSLTPKLKPAGESQDIRRDRMHGQKMKSQFYYYQKPK